MVLGVEEAADRLGVSRHRVRQLIRSRLLAAERVSGRYVVDEAGVDALTQFDRPAHVRSFSRRIAWACAAAADGVAPVWVTHSEAARLRARMDALPSDAAGWVARLRARAANTVTLRAGRMQLPRLLSDERVARSGVTATNVVRDAQVSGDEAELWVQTDAELSSLRTSLGLLPSTAGNLTIRSAHVTGLTSLGSGDGNAFRLIVAADLLNGRDARARYAGQELLETALGERRWRRSS
jgi:excisionase family DNA binding protein